jgi:hypothetical protein
VPALSTGSLVGVVKSVEKKKSVAGQFAVKYKSETYCSTFLVDESSAFHLRVKTLATLHIYMYTLVLYTD